MPQTHNIARNIVKTLLCCISALVISILMTMIMVIPAHADTSRLAELEAQSKILRSTIQDIQTEYLSSYQMESQLKAEKEQTEQRLVEIENELNEHRVELAAIVKSEYQTDPYEEFMNMIFSSTTLTDVINNYYYFERVQKAKNEVIITTSALQEEQKKLLMDVREKESTITEQVKFVENSEQALDKALEELKPQLEALQADLAEELTTLNGSQQLERNLDYLQNVKGITDIQAAIISSAYTTGYSGYNLCEAWAEQVYRNAGVSVPLLASAYDSYATYFISDDQSNIPPGAWVYGSGTHATANHVGIYVGNGLVMDNEASRTSTAVSMEEWLSWQTTVSAHTGTSGWFGWGYPPELNFSN